MSYLGFIEQKLNCYRGRDELRFGTRISPYFVPVCTTRCLAVSGFDRRQNLPVGTTKRVCEGSTSELVEHGLISYLKTIRY